MNNRKVLISVAIAIIISLNSFGQKCVKFVDNQTKVINTKGITMQVLGKPIEIGNTSVGTLNREVSDKLQKLDLLQYNICEQLKNIKTDFMREKLQAQYSNLMMRIMELVEKGGVQLPQDKVTALIGDAENKTEIVPEPTKKDVEIVPAVDDNRNNKNENNTDESNNSANIPESILDDEDIEIDITFPCEEFSTVSGTIRAFGMETSMDAQMAKRAARSVALEELASKVEITVKTVTEDYFLRTQKNLTEEIEKRIEGKTQTSVNQTLRGYTTVCEKYRQNKNTKKYSCYITLEISEESVLKPVYEDLKQDPDLKEALPNYEKFKDTFNEVMNDYEKSF